jgi:hypothetical protein
LDPEPLPASPPASPDGHRSWPVESVIVTLAGLRPFTDEATICAMPRTAPGSSVSPGLASETAAVAGLASSAKRSSSGRTRRTWAPATPWTPASCLPISPSSARWKVIFCWKSEAPSFCSSKSS